MYMGSHTKLLMRNCYQGRIPPGERWPAALGDIYQGIRPYHGACLHDCITACLRSWRRFPPGRIRQNNC